MLFLPSPRMSMLGFVLSLSKTWSLKSQPNSLFSRYQPQKYLGLETNLENVNIKWLFFQLYSGH